MSQPEERAKKKQKRPEGDDEVIIVCEGQTIEERRELRAELRDIATEISVRGQVLHDADKPDFKTIVERNDSAFKKVRYAREAVLEATNFDRLSTAVQKQVQGLAISVRRYNYQDFVKALQQHAEFGSVRKIVDWRKLGAAVGSCIQCVPEIEFMMGPLDKPDAPRKERAKRKKATGGDDDAEEVEPEQLTAKRDKQEDATTKRVKRMKHLIINNIAEPGARSALPKEVDLFSFVFNPNSFTQTVENMFDMSFQAKEQFAALEMNEEGIPVVRRTAVADDADAAPPPKTSQAVISFTMEDWKELCEAYGVTECRVEDRPGYEPDPVLQKMMSEQQKNRSHRIGMVGYTLGRRRHPPQPVLEKALSTASVNTAATESTVSSSAASSIASSPRGNSSSPSLFGHRCTADLRVSSSGHHSAGSSSPGRRSPTSTVSSSSSSSSSHPSSLQSGATASSKSRERSLRGHGHRTNGHRTSSKSPSPASAPSSANTAAVKQPPPPPPHTAPSPHAAAAAEPRAGSVCLQPPQLDHDDYDMLGALKPSLVNALPPAHVMASPPATVETSGAGLSAESVGDAHVRGRGLGQGDSAGSSCGGGRGCGGSACGGGGGSTGGEGADSLVREVTHDGGHGVSETDSLLLSAEASSPCHDRASAPSSADREPIGTPATTTTTTSYGTMTLYSDSPSPTHTDTRERRKGGFLAWLCAMLCCVTALVIVPWRLMRRRQNCVREDFNTLTDTQANSGVDDDECLDETVENRAGHASGDEGLMGAPPREGTHSVGDNDPVGVRERGCERYGPTDSCGVEGRPACVAVPQECARAAEGVSGEVGRGNGDGDGGASVGVQEGNDREAQARKGDAKACEITVLALRMFAGQRDLQVETLSAVWALAWAAEHNRCVLAEAGAGDLCVSAVRTSAGDAEVCYNALGALSVLTHDGHTRASLRKVDGACGVLVRCVSTQKRSAPIVDVALRVLTNLAADVASRDVLIGANVVDVVIIALRTHTRQRSVVHGALALMSNLLSLSDLNTNNNNNSNNRHTNHSTSSTASPHADACHTGSFNLSESLMKSACVCASRMGSQIGCESLCAAMRAFDRDAEISEVGCVVVVGVCVGGGEGVRKRMGEEGVAHLLLGAVRRWSDVRDARAHTHTSSHTAHARADVCTGALHTRTLIAAMRALACVCVEEENARDVSEHGACEVVVGVLGAHTRVCAHTSDAHTHAHTHTHTQKDEVRTDTTHSVDVPVLGCWLMGLLARGGSEARRRLRKAGAPEVCVRMLEVCVCAREGHCGVCASGGVTGQPAHDAPAVPLRDTSTETHAHTHTDMHRLVSRALWLVVCVCRGCHDSKWAMGEAGACQAVVKVLRAFEGDSHVQKLGYDAIRHLLGDGNNNRWLREAEPDELIAAALEAAQVHAELKSRDDDAWRTKPLRPIARPSPPAECITA